MSTQDNYKTLVSFLLPDGLLDYFDITEASTGKEGLSIYLEEKNIAPHGYTLEQLQSKGFHGIKQYFWGRVKKLLFCS